MKKIIAMLLALVMVLSLAACGAKAPVETPKAEDPKADAPAAVETPAEPAEKITLNFFNGNVEMVEWYEEAVKRFNAEHENITVVHEYAKEGTEALRIKFASGDAPDLTNVGNQAMIDDGRFVDLTDAEWWSRINPGTKSVAMDMKSGKNYYIPTNSMYTAVIYNKDIFNALGLKQAATWEVFEENLRAIKKAYPDVDPLYFGTKDAWTVGMLFGYIPGAEQRQLVGEQAYCLACMNGDLSVLKYGEAGGAFEKYAQGLLNLQAEGLLNSNALTATYSDTINAVANGDAAMIFQGMFTIADILKENPDAVNSLGVMAFPAMSDAVKPAMNQSLDSTYYITAETNHYDACVTFLNWLFEAENLADYSAHRGAPSVFVDVEVDLNPIFLSAVDAAKNCAVIGGSIEPVGFGGDQTGLLVQELLAGKYTAAELAVEFEKQWKTAFDAQ